MWGGRGGSSAASQGQRHQLKVSFFLTFLPFALFLRHTLHVLSPTLTSTRSSLLPNRCSRNRRRRVEQYSHSSERLGRGGLRAERRYGGRKELCSDLGDKITIRRQQPAEGLRSVAHSSAAGNLRILNNYTPIEEP